MFDICVQKRKNKYQIDNLLFNRDSPREMSGEGISKKELMPLLEAARWAPSSYNAQLWKFVYTLKGSKYWDKYLSLLDYNNRIWANNGGAIIVVATRKYFEYNDKFSRTAQFDAGAACQNFSLEGYARDLAVHLLEGFNYSRARLLCRIPKDYKILAMIVVGKRTKTIEKRSKRRPLKEIAIMNEFKS
jgi:nitroreductase